MRLILERAIGVLLILAATFGLILNILGFVYLPRVENAAQERVQETLTLLNGTLSTTGSALTVIDQSLEEAVATMDIVEVTTRDVSQALADTEPLLETMANIAGEELPASVAATQLSLEAAQEGAVAVEGVLFALNSIPLLQAPLYDPQVPLATTLSAVVTSLEPLPESLNEIEASMEIARANLGQVRQNVTTLANNSDRITSTIDEAKEVTRQYQQVVRQQQSIVADLQANVATWITWAARVFALILIWLAIAQIGLLSQGIEMVSRSRHTV
ncbi:MAG: hypothetical protein ACRDIB_18720 [Ardenticatenaceae bacterium]